MGLNILYISYDGATDPLGRSQILPYLEGLTKKGNSYILLSYEKRERLEDKEQVHKLKSELYQNKIHWVALRYHKKPPVLSTFYDVLKGIIISWHLIKRRRIEIIHARSYVPALIALSLKKFSKIKFMFDMRGLWPEERLEGNLWRNEGWLYRLAKFFEKRFLLYADGIVVLTEQSRKIIKALPYLNGKNLRLVTIPTCVDLKRFKVFAHEDESLTKFREKLVLVYLGSIGTWYKLEEMIDFFNVLRLKNKKAFFLFLSPGDKSFIESKIKQAEIPEDCFHIREVPYEDVPKWLSYAKASIFFIKPSYSKKGSLPTKFAESLACGLPVIINSGIGDCDEFVGKEKVGVIIRDFSSDSYSHAIDELQSLLKTKNLKYRCVSVAKKYFSLDEAVEKYQKIYHDLINEK